MRCGLCDVMGYHAKDGVFGLENSYLFAEERKSKIVEYLEKHKKATVQQLCDHFSVSSATIRNDLRALEQQGRIDRAHGGALTRSRTGYEVDIGSRVNRLDEKRAIAGRALEFIDDGDTIILDSGTTVRELARRLDQRKHLTIITDDLRTALILEEQPTNTIIVLGGILRQQYHCTFGDAARLQLSELAVDKAFMAANSVSPSFGASTPSLQTSELKQAMIRSASQVILLCDQNKLNRSSLARFAKCEDIDILVTDYITETNSAELQEYGVDVVVASVPPSEGQSSHTDDG